MGECECVEVCEQTFHDYFFLFGLLLTDVISQMTETVMNRQD